MPAHLTPSGEFTVRIERGAVAWYWLYRRRASLGMISKGSDKRVWPVAVPGRCASPGRRVGDVRLLKTSSRLLFTELAGPYASN